MKKPKHKPFRVRIAWGKSEETRATPCDYVGGIAAS
jgi:hypothetical protein